MKIRNFGELEREFLYWKNKVNNVNRYFDDTPLLSDLYQNRDLLKHTIRDKSYFYRGRIYNLDEKVTNAKELEDWVDWEDARFQGYKKQDSSAPTAKDAKEGRLNGNGISVLYTCNDINTVINELRPTRNELISVAKFITKKGLCFADLTEIKSTEIAHRGIPYKKLSDLILLIADEFAVPHYAGHNYAFTQYLAGHFMNMEFDGVIFRSSLNPSGENFVFFYPEDCEAIHSGLYKVTDIKIEFEPIIRQEIFKSME